MTVTCSEPERIAQAREYVLGALSAASAEAFEDHLAGCAGCAQRVLEQTRGLDALVDDLLGVGSVSDRFVRAAETSPGARRRVDLWAVLARHVLSPAAACAYLVLLLAVVPAFWLLVSSRGRGREGASAPAGQGRDTIAQGAAPRPPGPPASSSLEGAVRLLPPVLKVFGEETTRGVTAPRQGSPVGRGENAREPSPEPAPPESSPRPLRLEWPSPGGSLLLELHTGIDEEELRDPASAFVVEVWKGERLLWSQHVAGQSFERDGTLRITLSTERLSSAAVYTLAVRLDKPGDPFDREVLFRKSISASRRP